MASLVTYLVVFVAFYLLAVPSLSCPHYQKEALLEFKGLVVRELKQYKNWSSLVLMSWNSSSNCCEWERVTCNSRVVTDLHLSFFIPLPVSVKILAPLFRVRTLSFLDISENNIRGQIPSPGFGNLTKLTYLDMRANVYLNGSIPEDLYLLRDLQHLDLSANDFEGSLSSALGGLRNLRYLNLLENNVHGRIPEGIGNMTELTELSLHDNLFSGGIPSSFRFGNLTKLVYLDMSRNNLDGSIPQELFGPLRSLKYIDLSFNHLSGELPRNIEGVNMNTLVLCYNHFYGSLPKSFSNLSSLLYLDLSSNHLSGTIFPVFWPNSSIETLDLSANRFSGPIIPSLFGRNTKALYLYQNEFSRVIPQAPGVSNISSLLFLDLHDNQIAGGFPTFLRQCPSLRFLDLSKNYFEGSIPSRVGNADEFARLGIIKLSNNLFHGQVPEWVSNLSSLQLLDLSYNNFSGRIFPIVCSVRYLYVVNLSNNRLCGPLPSFAPVIQYLSISHNQFSGSLPSFLGNLSLTLLDVHDNNFIGAIPASLFQCSALEVLDLSNNYLEGSIPIQISNLPALRILDLSKNGLTGEIPHSLSLNLINVVEASVTPLFVVGDLDGVGCSANVGCRVSRRIDVSSYIRDLIVNWKRSKHYLSTVDFALYSLLDLSDNGLSGPIPTSLGDSQILKSLNLSHNRLSSYIPSSLGNLESLEVLDLSHNALSGVIPSTLAKLQQLNTIDLSNNQLVGRIPDSPQLDSLNDPRFYANNSGICGLQIQVPCSTPSPPWAQMEATEKSESKDAIFSWEIADIVFPISFVGTVAVMYSSGYFHSVGKVKKSALGKRRKQRTITTPAQGI